MATNSTRINLGRTHNLIDASEPGAGSSSKNFSVESDSVLVSLWIESLAGDLDVVVTTVDDAGQELDVITFPTQSAPTTELLLKKAGTTLSNLRVTATYSAAATFRVTARAINSGSGDTSIKISGADAASASAASVGTSATTIIAAAGTDRSGLVLKNAEPASGNTLYIGFSMAEASTSVGYPLAPGEALGMDIAAGVAVFGVANAGTVDIRILEAGN